MARNPRKEEVVDLGLVHDGWWLSKISLLITSGDWNVSTWIYLTKIHSMLSSVLGLREVENDLRNRN